MSLSGYQPNGNGNFHYSENLSDFFPGEGLIDRDQMLLKTEAFLRDLADTAVSNAAGGSWLFTLTVTWTVPGSDQITFSLPEPEPEEA